MTSVNFNNAAVSALRNLQQTNASLDSTQNRISTGLKIGEAKDNAAYWSISTTLKSDNKALSTVKDALGLGSAAVDVAYQSLNNAKDVLDEIKSKLTAATSPAADKAKVQSEIAELQKQLVAIASSANFSGENWLAVDSGATGYNEIKKVVSSYSRDANGAVTISTIDISTASMSLTNRATGTEGILDGGKSGMTTAMTGGLSGVGQTTAASTSGSSVSTITAGTAGADASTADSYRVVYKVDGQTYTLNVAKATYTAYASAAAIDGTVTEAQHAAFLQEVLSSNAEFLTRASVATSGAASTITSLSKGTSSSAEIVSASFVTSGTPTAVGTQTTTLNNAGVNAKTTMTAAFANNTNGLVLDSNDSLTFDVTIGSNTATRISINKNLIDNVLGSTDGKIDTVDKLKSVLTSALRSAGLTSVAVSDATGAIVLTGGKEAISIANVATSKGTNLLSFDITTMDTQQISALITSVNNATAKVITAATTLGSVAARIDLQTTFVNTLMDTIDKGVSGLIDADMNEESTKLQALQVKQQLGVQALSIANQSAQNVLSLFRS